MYWEGRELWLQCYLRRTFLGAASQEPCYGKERLFLAKAWGPSGDHVEFLPEDCLARSEFHFCLRFFTDN
jgi:hypothetical protein